ncbi:YdcF family protein [Shewanella waksmanii]|uniref:YdcF family protein n=1 Tax=Shewanella waksmanii TaxID=213783 RepID=UPI0037367A02
MPIPFTLMLLLLAVLFWHRSALAKSLVSVAVIWLLGLSSQFGSALLVAPLERQYSINNVPLQGQCYIAVLGNSHQVAHSQFALQQLSSTALARLIEGLRQGSLTQGCYFIFSGWTGGGAGPAHADIMADAAMSLGISRDRIITFPEARDTIEEAQYVEQYLGQTPFKLVTSATHMPRAMATFEAEGLVPIAAPTDFITPTDSWWNVSVANLSASQRAIHEYLGLLWLQIKYVF